MRYADSSVKNLKGVGKARAERLAKLGIETVKDLVYTFPRAYERRGNVKTVSEAEINSSCSLLLTVATSVKTATAITLIFVCTVIHTLSFCA